MKKIYTTCYRSEIGLLAISGTETGITAVMYADEPEETQVVPENLLECRRQLEEYFGGARQEFTVAVLLQGTDFQKQVWTQLGEIPYGQTVSYQDIANKINKVAAVRAVGKANGQNKLNIIIPCHRVIGSSGQLTGYGGGLWRKEWLLNHERRQCSYKPG